MARIAIILDQDFEDAELNKPYGALLDNGHSVDVIGIESGTTAIGKNGSKQSVDFAAADVNPSDYDALVIPGGYSPDHLRTDENVVAFTKEFVESEKPVAAICHAGSILIEAGVVKGRTVTSWPSIRTDLTNAGATWVDEEVVVDGHLITSRKPSDIPAFMTAVLAAIGDAEGAKTAANTA